MEQRETFKKKGASEKSGRGRTRLAGGRVYPEVVWRIAGFPGDKSHGRNGER